MRSPLSRFGPELVAGTSHYAPDAHGPTIRPQGLDNWVLNLTLKGSGNVNSDKDGFRAETGGVLGFRLEEALLGCDTQNPFKSGSGSDGRIDQAVSILMRRFAERHPAASAEFGRGGIRSRMRGRKHRLAGVSGLMGPLPTGEWRGVGMRVKAGEGRY